MAACAVNTRSKLTEASLTYHTMPKQKITQVDEICGTVLECVMGSAAGRISGKAKPGMKDNSL